LICTFTCASPDRWPRKTIATGTAAAAREGSRRWFACPTRLRRLDNAATVALDSRAVRPAQGVVDVYVTGAITKNLAGEELAPIGSLKKAGVVATYDDGHCVQNNDMMRRALEYAKMFELPVLDHCQDYSLVTDGVMREGYVEHGAGSARLAGGRRGDDGGGETFCWPKRPGRRCIASI